MEKICLLFRGIKKIAISYLQGGFVLVDLTNFLWAVHKQPAEHQPVDVVDVLGILVGKDINCCVIIKVIISRSELRYPNSQNLEYVTLNL